MDPASIHQGNPAKGSPLSADSGVADASGQARCGSPAGGRYFSEPCGRTALYASRQRSMSAFASSSVSNDFPAIHVPVWRCPRCRHRSGCGPALRGTRSPRHGRACQAHVRPPDAASPGTEVGCAGHRSTRGSLTKDRLGAIGIRQEPLQPSVLRLEILQPLRLIARRPAVLPYCRFHR